MKVTMVPSAPPETNPRRPLHSRSVQWLIVAVLWTGLGVLCWLLDAAHNTTNGNGKTGLGFVICGAVLVVLVVTYVVAAKQWEYEEHQASEDRT